MHKNSKGKIWYGMHFYPGVVEYDDEGKEAYRVFINENTIRSMGPTFEGRPVFVSHVDEVNENIDELRKEADGWVVNSFYNPADGKHWVKFITVTDRAERAINKGMRLSNCYRLLSFSNGGTWNGVQYEKEITNGEYEHLAIVPNPRYEESLIKTPEEFKRYNEENSSELIKLSNNKDGKGMKLQFFKREKVKNDAGNLEEMLVLLPKSKREVAVIDLVTEMDKIETEKDKPRLVNKSDTFEIDGEKLTVAEIVAELKELRNAKNEDDEELENEDDEDKKENEDDEDKKENEDDEELENEDDEELENEDDEELENEDDEDEDEMENKKKKNKKKKNELEAKRRAKAKADRLRNAPDRMPIMEAKVDFSDDRVSRGRSRYGS